MADPLGGSWYVESLTDQMETRAEKYFDEIENLGGVIPAIEKGYFQMEIARAASDYQQKIDDKQLIHVGVNAFIKQDEDYCGNESRIWRMAGSCRILGEYDE